MKIPDIKFRILIFKVTITGRRIKEVLTSVLMEHMPWEKLTAKLVDRGVDPLQAEQQVEMLKQHLLEELREED